MRTAFAVFLALAIAVGALAADEHSPHWSYTGATGPSHWATLSPDYGTCADGSAQSPIDIRNAQARPLRNISIRYPATMRATALDNGHTVQWNFPTGASIVLNGTTYKLLQMHFHSPSEHKVDGKLYAVEIHFVHQAADGGLAVLGVFVDQGKASSAWAHVLKTRPSTAGRPLSGIQLDALLPTGFRTYRYTGSLTTPPCSETVAWNVFTKPITMSAAQIKAFRKLYFHNNRPPQPLHGRTVEVDSSPSS